jgi:hypothetical protein
MDKFYEAVTYCTEEAVINSLVGSEETIGYMGNRSPGKCEFKIFSRIFLRIDILGLPIDIVLSTLKERNVLRV